MKDLHSNMVRFIMTGDSSTASEAFNLHSNMVRFIMGIYTIYILETKQFTFQYG